MPACSFLSLPPPSLLCHAASRVLERVDCAEERNGEDPDRRLDLRPLPSPPPVLVGVASIGDDLLSSTATPAVASGLRDGFCLLLRLTAALGDDEDGDGAAAVVAGDVNVTRRPLGACGVSAAVGAESERRERFFLVVVLAASASVPAVDLFFFFFFVLPLLLLPSLLVGVEVPDKAPACACEGEAGPLEPALTDLPLFFLATAGVDCTRSSEEGLRASRPSVPFAPLGAGLPFVRACCLSPL